MTRRRRRIHQRPERDAVAAWDQWYATNGHQDLGERAEPEDADRAAELEQWRAVWSDAGEGGR
jgi:hypothetical protein